MAQTSVSGKMFENDLRKIVSSLVWHNRYLGDKHDREDRYINHEEIDIYLTGARHLLMYYSQTQLESVENKTEEEYKVQRQSFNTNANKDNMQLKNQLMYWDMFYYGVRIPESMYSKDSYGRLVDPTNKLVEGLKKYEEKNTYYRELYGLPEYNGTICHCNRCQYEEQNMKICKKCGSKDIDPERSAPSIYSYAMEFPLYYNRFDHLEWNPYDYIPDDWQEGSYTDEDVINYFLNNVYNPYVFLYDQPLKTRLYAEYTTTFVDDKREELKNDHHYKYINHMTYAKIHPFMARLSDRFELLYIKSSDIVYLSDDFKKVYDECRRFMNYRYYTEAFRNQYSEYEGFIGMAILFMALQRMQSKYLEADITRDFYDLESIEVVYNAYSVPFYDEIPITYHNKIIKAINRLLAIKGTNNCFREIFAIFGYSTLNMYQYYILKQQNFDASGNPIFMFNPDGSEKRFNDDSNLETMYHVSIVKGDIGENPYTYMLDSLNYMDYYGVTEPDTYWLNDDELLHKLYYSDYNFIETKYIGIQMVFKLTRFTIETEYIMRMLLDNRFNGSNEMTVYHNSLGIDIDLYTLVIYIMYIVGKQFGLEGGGSLEPLTDPAKLSAIYGFNFIEDFSTVYGYLARKFIYNYKSGYLSKINNSESEFFISTDYSELQNRSDLTSLPNSITDAMDKELLLNNIDFSNIYQEYINSGYLKPTIYNGGSGISCAIKYKLIYAFNTVRKLLTSYTDDEYRVRNLFNSKFINVYYSPEVCAFCGAERENHQNPFAYCHNVACASYHLYDDGPGPLLKSLKGKIPSAQAIDTSKDTLTIQYRDIVYADFVEKYETYNSAMKQLIQTFNTIPSYDFTETIDACYVEFSSNTNHVYLADTPDIAKYADQIRKYTKLEISHYNEETHEYDYTTARILNIEYIESEPGSTEMIYDITVDDDVTAYAGDIVTIRNFREVTLSIDDWIHMLDEGVIYRAEYMESKRIYDTAVETGEVPAGTTIEELEADMLEKQELYTHTLYYLIGLLSEFVNSPDEIDLDTYMWIPSVSVKSLLEQIGLYDALFGLKAKVAFRKFLSNKDYTLSSQIESMENPYYYSLDDIRWVHVYLNNYFLNNTWTSSRLVDTIQNYFVDDYDEYMSNNLYGNKYTDYESSLSYMDETMYSMTTVARDPVTGEMVTSKVKTFDYIKEHIQAILDADNSYGVNERNQEIDIGIGRPINNSFDKLGNAYNGITQLYLEFARLTWNAKDHRVFNAVRRLQKMLMTTHYAKKIYSTSETDENKVAKSYGELLDSINPIFTVRVDSMTENQRIIELEYSLSCLDKISDDLIYLHAYGGFNMKKMISYIFKLIIFFKSAKADLLDFALEFRVDDKTDNLIKYMTECTKLSTDAIISPDQWAIVDYLKSHEKISILNAEKAVAFTFTDIVLNIEHTSMLQSANFFADQFRQSPDYPTITHIMELDHVLYDYVKHDSRSVSGLKSSFEKLTDKAILAMRKVYALDMDAEPTYDEYNNAIYPFLYDEHGNKVLRENYNIL